MTGIMQMLASPRITTTSSAAPFATLIFDLDAVNFSSFPVTGNIDATGAYSMTVNNAANSMTLSSYNGYNIFRKVTGASGTDLFTSNGPDRSSSAYTVFMAYQTSSTQYGRLLNTNVISPDFVMGAYNSGTGYQNVFYPNYTVNLSSDVADNTWRFIWGVSDGTIWGNLYIASASVNNVVGPTAVYKSASGSPKGPNGFRLFGRYLNATVSTEIATGNIGFVKVYDGVCPLAQIQSQWADYHTRFAI